MMPPRHKLIGGEPVAVCDGCGSVHGPVNQYIDCLRATVFSLRSALAAAEKARDKAELELRQCKIAATTTSSSPVQLAASESLSVSGASSLATTSSVVSTATEGVLAAAKSRSKKAPSSAPTRGRGA